MSYNFLTETISENEKEINKLKEEAELYGLTFTEYLLYLIFYYGINTYEQGDYFHTI